MLHNFLQRYFNWSNRVVHGVLVLRDAGAILTLYPSLRNRQLVSMAANKGRRLIAKVYDSRIRPEHLVHSSTYHSPCFPYQFCQPGQERAVLSFCCLRYQKGWCYRMCLFRGGGRQHGVNLMPLLEPEPFYQ